ncbi:helix-turn-helix transcriptional regulator [Pseudomonas sp. SD17-1]|jgi:phage repressor protein C with HTH and peptisase S24 domain|uniref:XRE family transcriptional regulator n=1 Tax=Pseudomonas sp. SD17-1 TaxID=2976883 RepID=UPI0023DC1345|nr:helix-turn-helix transcriptional regulator [Pseudomonas sp. SD17-1]WEJ23636.1 helix-turn-helix transcriptional regulator [Pseudomonas sp. SD17-1]
MEFKDRLKSRMEALGLRATDLSERTGVSRATVTFWLNGTNGAKGKNLLALSKALDCNPEWLSSGKGPQEARRSAPQANAELLGDLAVWDEGDPLDDDECEVPYYAEVEFSGGHGMTEVVEVTDRKLRFSNATLRAAGVDCNSAACARVRGRSMERLILDGAAIGFDLTDTSIIDGEIYAFNHGGMLRVKYLYRLPAGAVRIRSENTEDYPDEIMTAEQFQEEVRMLGRVFWWSTVRRSPKRK